MDDSADGFRPLQGRNVSVVDSKAFLDGGKSAVQSLRRAFADVLVSAGADPEKPQDVSRRFGLDKTLSWRIARVIREEDAWEAVAHIPRRPSVRIFVDRMAKHGVPREKLNALLESVNEFERFIEVHTGDRETLEMMVGAAAKRSADKRMETFRKNGFQANSAVWGVRAKLQFSASFVIPSSQPGQLETAMICGFGALRRLRPDLPWTIAAAMAWDDQGRTDEDVDRRPAPLHADGLIDGAPLLPDFCSDPLPQLRTVRTPGTSRFELVEGPVGNTAATTVVLGWKWRGPVPMEQSAEGEMGEHGMRISTPVEAALLDVFIHKSLTFAMEAQAAIYSDLPRGPRYPDDGPTAGLLPMPTDISDLGEGPPDTTTPELPRYSEIVSYTARRLGFGINDFHGFRYRLKYPPIPTFALIRHPLLKK